MDWCLYPYTIHHCSVAAASLQHKLSCSFHGCNDERWPPISSHFPPFLQLEAAWISQQENVLAICFSFRRWTALQGSRSILGLPNSESLDVCILCNVIGYIEIIVGNEDPNWWRRLWLVFVWAWGFEVGNYEILEWGHLPWRYLMQILNFFAIQNCDKFKC